MELAPASSYPLTPSRPSCLHFIDMDGQFLASALVHEPVHCLFCSRMTVGLDTHNVSLQVRNKTLCFTRKVGVSVNDVTLSTEDLSICYSF